MAEAFDEQRQQKRQQESQAAVPQSSSPVSSYRKVRVPAVVLRQPACFLLDTRTDAPPWWGIL